MPYSDPIDRQRSRALRWLLNQLADQTLARLVDDHATTDSQESEKALIDYLLNHYAKGEWGPESFVDAVSAYGVITGLIQAGEMTESEIAEANRRRLERTRSLERLAETLKKLTDNGLGSTGPSLN